ncbi:MAG: hypothetical protein QGH70_11390 [Nitrospinota bacterium]|nr:hypothetical protein [Nitrospinota bacterium]
MRAKARSSVTQACLYNLREFLEGAISSPEWTRHLEEFESRLTPEPDLPFEESALVSPDSDLQENTGRPKVA